MDLRLEVVVIPMSNVEASSIPSSRTEAKSMVGERRGMAPMGAVVRGLVAGAVGTLAMDLLWFSRYEWGGGKSGFRDWESSSDVSSWEQAPAPAHIGMRLIEGTFKVQLPEHRARLVNHVTHWGYGILSGVQYGIVAGSLRAPRVRYGVPFGASVWAFGYVVLPAAGLHEQIREYERATLAKDLSAHVLYGPTTAAVFDGLSPRRGGPGDRRSTRSSPDRRALDRALEKVKEEPCTCSWQARPVLSDGRWSRHYRPTVTPFRGSFATPAVPTGFAVSALSLSSLMFWTGRRPLKPSWRADRMSSSTS